MEAPKKILNMIVSTILVVTMLPVPMPISAAGLENEITYEKEEDIFLEDETFEEDIFEETEPTVEETFEEETIPDEDQEETVEDIVDTADNTEWVEETDETETPPVASAQAFSAEVKPAKPVINSIQATNYKTIEIQWTGTYDADGYELYRKSENETVYKKIKHISRDDYYWGWPTSWGHTDTGLETGTKYAYKVRAFTKEYYWDVDYNLKTKTVYSDYSAVKSGRPKLNTTTLTLTNANSKALQLKWKKVTGADGYQIERSTQKESGYTVVKTIKDGSTLTYKNSSLTLGTKYYYRIRAYRFVNGKKVFSSYSGKKALQVKLKQNKITKIKRVSKDTMELTWGKVVSAQGYRIYRSTSKDGTYTRVKTIKNGSTVKTKVSGQKHGEKYYYKVRAYTTVNGAYVYSPYSKVMAKTMGYYAYQTESGLARCNRLWGTDYYKSYTSSTQAEKDMKTVKVKVWNINSQGNKYTAYKYITIHKKLAPTVTQIFKEIYEGKEKFPIKDVGGYSWRGGRSEHNEGLAIDINPNENYMIDNGTILAGSFWDPKRSPYSITENGDVVTIMRKYGFEQGFWGNRKDYMHFSYFGT